MIIEGGRSNNCTAEHLKTIPEENARKLINTEFSSYLHTDKRDIGCGSKLLRAQTAISAGIKVTDGTLNSRDLLQIVVVVSYKMNEEEALAIISTNVSNLTCIFEAPVSSLPNDIHLYVYVLDYSFRYYGNPYSDIKLHPDA